MPTEMYPCLGFLWLSNQIITANVYRLHRTRHILIH